MNVFFTNYNSGVLFCSVRILGSSNGGARCFPAWRRPRCGSASVAAPGFRWTKAEPLLPVVLQTTKPEGLEPQNSAPKFWTGLKKWWDAVLWPKAFVSFKMGFWCPGLNLCVAILTVWILAESELEELLLRLAFLTAFCPLPIPAPLWDPWGLLRLKLGKLWTKWHDSLTKIGHQWPFFFQVQPILSTWRISATITLPPSIFFTDTSSCSNKSMDIDGCIRFSTASGSNSCLSQVPTYFPNSLWWLNRRTSTSWHFGGPLTWPESKLSDFDRFRPLQGGWAFDHMVHILDPLMFGSPELTRALLFWWWCRYSKKKKKNGFWSERNYVARGPVDVILSTPNAEMIFRMVKKARDIATWGLKRRPQNIRWSSFSQVELAFWCKDRPKHANLNSVGQCDLDQVWMQFVTVCPYISVNVGCSSCSRCYTLVAWVQNRMQLQRWTWVRRSFSTLHLQALQCDPHVTHIIYIYIYGV